MSRSSPSRPTAADASGAPARPSGTAAAAVPRFPKAVRQIRNHGHLFGSLALSFAIFAVHTILWPETRLATRLLVAWDTGVLVYLVLALSLITRFELALVRQRAAIHDEGGMAILVLTVGSAVASLGAIVAELGGVPKDQGRALSFALAVATILLSWALIHVIFALHYAHEYYGEGDEGCGLVFPSDDRPDYWDFVYFSFVIGMTFQVSDVQVTSKLLRRAVVAHGLVSFLFNVAILALVVNLGAGLV
ncbi:MAG TPA: DUF1345 domain-containing protein [Candidatus Binatia bacterium]|nr:DUF1345 domain-containing protein [Candidatus Binatia bacterium]